MGRKKKRAAPNPRERIFCYYCDRTFNTEQELLMHQREKHLRCPTCNKRMLSVPSLTIHSEQMHNTTVTSVPNAISGRTSTHVDVLGMKGVPEEYYLALEGKSNKRSNNDNTDYHTYPAQQAHLQSQGYAAASYPSQGYGTQSYVQGYHQQHAPHHGYASQGYLANSYSPQGYAYPPQQGYAATAHPPHATTYPQHTYGPQQPPAQSGPQQPPQYSSSYPAYSYPSSTAPAQPQSNGPQPVPDEQPPSLPSTRKEASPAQTGGSKDPPTATAPPPGKAAAPSEPGITIVFDRTDLSMEELRAQLPQYRVSVPRL